MLPCSPGAVRRRDFREPSTATRGDGACCPTETEQRSGGPMHRKNLRRAARLGALALTLALPAAAQAATHPTVTTGGPTMLTFNSVRLTGSVDPNGASTTWQF